MNINNLNPKNQEILIGYNHLFLNFVNLYKNKRLPNKILLSGTKGIGKATFAYHIINYIFSFNENFSYDLKSYKINNLNRSFNLVKNNSHPNFHLIFG